MIGDSKKSATKLTGAKILIESLVQEGVETVFGFPGGQILPVYHELVNCPLKHILVRHEQGAAHAADGYARATGKPGVCIVTSGPGATNLVTGIANAYMDSIPLVAITGQVSVNLLGRDSFQEADITGITLPITKYSCLVKDVKDLAATVHEAFYIATTGRPGPVVIDLPKDVATAKATFRYPPRLNLPGYKNKPCSNNARVLQVAQALKESKRPLIYAGGGVISAGADEFLLKVAETCGIPVTTTLMGKGSFPENHDLSLGMLGMHGTVAANYAVSNCDFLLALGARFDDRVTGRLETFATKARIAHVDIDPAEIGKNVMIDIPIVGDVGQVLVELLNHLESSGGYAPWLEVIDGWRKDHPLSYSMEDDGEIRPQMVIEELYRLTGGDALITTDVGQHQMWVAQFYRSNKPRSFFSSGGLGAMGFGLPAAMGIQVARPGELVINISGDGGFQMNAQELTTINQYKLPVKVIILNNGCLGLVRQWQELFYEKRYAYSDISCQPDFVKLAEAHGIRGLRVKNPSEVAAVLDEAIKDPGPVVVDVVARRDENVYPMVPPNGALNKMLRGVEG